MVLLRKMTCTHLSIIWWSSRDADNDSFAGAPAEKNVQQYQYTATETYERDLLGPPAGSKNSVVSRLLAHLPNHVSKDIHIHPKKPMKEKSEIHLQVAAALLAQRTHMSKEINIQQKRPMRETC